MIRDPNKRYPAQPNFFSEIEMLGYRLFPVISSQYSAPYVAFVTMNGYPIAVTEMGSRSECEVMGFNAMQAMAHSMIDKD